MVSICHYYRVIGLLLLIICCYSCNLRRPASNNQDPIGTIDSIEFDENEDIPSDVIDSIVHLSFLGGALGEQAHPFVNYSQREIIYNGVEGIASIYRLTKNLSLEGKSYPVKTAVYTINDTICSIYGEIKIDIMNALREMYFVKYGIPKYRAHDVNADILKWKYTNQELDVSYLTPQRVIYHPELKEYIHTHFYDFKGILINYIDYELDERYQVLSQKGEVISRKEKQITDSLRAIEQQKAEDKKREKLLKDASQI